MSDSPRLFLFQPELLSAILKELDRQNPGARINQAAMDAFVQAADDIIAAARQGLLPSPKEVPR